MYDHRPLFYPDPVFGWTFCAVLLGFLAVATYTDVGRLTIPKKLTLPMLAVGILFSIVRGAWMGSILEGSPSTPGVVWHFARSPALGALDGLLCALEGFLAAFVLFFILWRVGMMRGGDVKLVAALGAWVGPIGVMAVIFGSVPVLLILGCFLLIRKMFRRGVQKTVFNVKHGAARDNLKKTAGGMKRREVWLAYSLPVAISAAVLLPFVVLRDQRHPVPAPSETPTQQASVQP